MSHDLTSLGTIMEIKEVTSEEAEEIQKGEPEKVLRKSDKILDSAKENLSPSEIAKVKEIAFQDSELSNSNLNLKSHFCNLNQLLKLVSAPGL